MFKPAYTAPSNVRTSTQRGKNLAVDRGPSGGGAPSHGTTGTMDIRPWMAWLMPCHCQWNTTYFTEHTIPYNSVLCCYIIAVSEAVHSSYLFSKCSCITLFFCGCANKKIIKYLEKKSFDKPGELVIRLRTCCCSHVSSASRNSWNCWGDLRLSTESNFSFALNDVRSALMSSFSLAVMTLSAKSWLMSGEHLTSSDSDRNT